MLSKISSTEISKCKDKHEFEEAEGSVITGGGIAKGAREELVCIVREYLYRSRNFIEVVIL